MSPLIERWIRPEILDLAAYRIPDSTGLVKLDAMENPYTWPDSLITSWLEMLKTTSVNRYPDPAGHQLVTRLRDVMAIPEGQAVLLGNGSDELIQTIALALAGADRVIMAPEPGFVMYRMIARFTGMQYHGVPLRSKDFALDLNAFLTAIERYDPAVIFLAYPNNPTGNHWSRIDIEQILQATNGLVVMDEAYSPFAADTFMEDLGRYDNLVVMRTLSKLGLAGLRLGYLCGPPAWLDEFNKVRLPYNINTLTQLTAEHALANIQVFTEQASWIKQRRAELIQQLATFPGLQVFPSDANFILLRVPTGTAEAIFSALLAQGILIKKLDDSHPLLDDCLRVTVGKPEENSGLIRALADILSP